MIRFVQFSIFSGRSNGVKYVSGILTVGIAAGRA